MLVEVTSRNWLRAGGWVVVGVVAAAHAVPLAVGSQLASPRSGRISAVEAPQLAASEKVSPRWAGYVIEHSGVAYTSATGTWVEPHLKCPSARAAPSLSATWVGLGGYPASSMLAQVGVDANCSQGGRASYGAWFELLPYLAHAFSGTVEAGDTITATVSILK